MVVIQHRHVQFAINTRTFDFIALQGLIWKKKKFTPIVLILEKRKVKKSRIPTTAKYIWVVQKSCQFYLTLRKLIKFSLKLWGKACAPCAGDTKKKKIQNLLCTYHHSFRAWKTNFRMEISSSIPNPFFTAAKHDMLKFCEWQKTEE